MERYQENYKKRRSYRPFVYLNKNEYKERVVPVNTQKPVKSEVVSEGEYMLKTVKNFSRDCLKKLRKTVNRIQKGFKQNKEREYFSK